MRPEDRAGRRGPGAGWRAIAIFVAVIELVFGLSGPDFISGLALGSLYGIIGVGIVLIYRTSRVINFAAGAVGAVPAVIALVLVLEYGVNYLVVLPIVLVGGPVLGLLTDLVMRRFDAVPRLIATVMTIAVAQSFAVLGFFIPVWLGPEGHQPGDHGHDAVAAPGVAHQPRSAVAHRERDRRISHRRRGDRRPGRVPALHAARDRAARLGRERRPGAAAGHPGPPGGGGGAIKRTASARASRLEAWLIKTELFGPRASLAMAM